MLKKLTNAVTVISELNFFRSNEKNPRQFLDSSDMKSEYGDVKYMEFR